MHKGEQSDYRRGKGHDNGYKGGKAEDRGYKGGRDDDYGYNRGYSNKGKYGAIGDKPRDDWGYTRKADYDYYSGRRSDWSYGWDKNSYDKGSKEDSYGYGYGRGDSYGKGSKDRSRPPLRGSNSAQPSGKGAGKDYYELEKLAIREINEQLRNERNEGRVWIANWQIRFQQYFGQLREFLENHSDKFTIIPGDGRRFTVAFARRAPNAGKGWEKGYGKGKSRDDKGWGKGKYTEDKGAIKGKSREDKGSGKGKSRAQLEKMALQEITDEMLDETKEGRVWISSWNSRFLQHFGQLRDFLQSHSDKFTIVPGEGRRFTVEFAGGAGGKPAAGKGMEKGVRKGKSKEELEQIAIQEITDQILDESKEGRVWISNWNSRFQRHFGQLRDFLGSHADKFTMIPGDGRRFTVALAEGYEGPPEAGKREEDDEGLVVDDDDRREEEDEPDGTELSAQATEQEEPEEKEEKEEQEAGEKNKKNKIIFTEPTEEVESKDEPEAAPLQVETSGEVEAKEDPPVAELNAEASGEGDLEI